MIADRLLDDYAQQLRDEIDRGVDKLFLAEVGFREPARNAAGRRLAAETLPVTVVADPVIPLVEREPTTPTAPTPKRSQTSGRQSKPRWPAGRTGVFAEGRGTDPDLM